MDQANGHPTDRELCPRCGGSGVIFGSIEAPFSDRARNVCFFPRSVPRGIFNQNQGVGLPMESRACLTCGHVWSSLDPGRLRRHLGAHGGELARQELDEIERGIYRDLPDTDLAREIAEKVAEIDSMVRRGEFGAVARYRELRGVPWDEAIKAMSSWSRLTRAEKLELFGWMPKKKPSIDEWF
jgi:hypothetical protein